jgi:hypothetical protein
MISYNPYWSLHVIQSDWAVLNKIIRILFESYQNPSAKNFGTVWSKHNMIVL